MSFYTRLIISLGFGFGFDEVIRVDFFGKSVGLGCFYFLMGRWVILKVKLDVVWVLGFEGGGEWFGFFFIVFVGFL